MRLEEDREGGDLEAGLGREQWPPPPPQSLPQGKEGLPDPGTRLYVTLPPGLQPSHQAVLIKNSQPQSLNYIPSSSHLPPGPEGLTQIKPTSYPRRPPSITGLPDPTSHLLVTKPPSTWRSAKGMVSG